MKRGGIPICVAIFLSVFCTGCFPVHVTTRPGATGVVVDADTRTAVVGATVSVIPLGINDPPAAVDTGFAGAFQVPAKRQWGIYIMPTDIFPIAYRLSVRREGYRQTDVQFSFMPLGAGTTTNFGNIQLRAVAK